MRYDVIILLVALHIIRAISACNDVLLKKKNIKAILIYSGVWAFV